MVDFMEMGVYVLGKRKREWVTWIVLIGAFGVGPALGACGSARQGPGSELRAEGAANAVHSQLPELRRLKGDEDDDETGEYRPNSRDTSDADFDDDSGDRRRGFYDRDDLAISGFGEAAKGADRRAIAGVVGSYFAAAASGNGVEACSLIERGFAQTIPRDYGKAPGPLYLRGGTCPAVMSHLFKYDRQSLTGKVSIVALRVGGKEARVLVGSTKMRATFVTLRRVGSRWRMVGLLGYALP